MGITDHKKVMVTVPIASPLTVAVTLCLAITLTYATVCPPGEQYWHPQRASCANCTRCETHGPGHVVIRPCEVHRDTVCGPISDLEIDWSWLGKREHHRHHHRRKLHRGRGGEFNKGVTEDGVGTGSTAEFLSDVTSTEAPFTSTETLVWDWQAVALSLAVFACLLFFLVAGLYSVHQARQWKRLKDNFEADVEELSARLNLMVTSGELTDKLEPNTGQISDGNYMSNHCVYLEQLLVRKDSKIGPGNVYIEESNATNTNTISSTSYSTAASTSCIPTMKMVS